MIIKTPLNPDFDFYNCKKLYKKYQKQINDDSSFNEIIKNTHKLIKEITKNYENIEFNKAIARVREFTNFLEKVKINTQEEKESYLFALVTIIKLFSPIAPHLCSELLEIFEKEMFYF